MHNTTLRSVLEEIYRQTPNATFIVDGDSLKADIVAIGYPKSARFIFARDSMAIGRGVPEILSPEFIALRTEAHNNPFYESYTVEEYNQKCVYPLSSLVESNNSDIYLIQYDCYLSQIWQLTMQAYIEQLRIVEKVKRICFFEKTDTDFCTELAVSGINEIPVFGSHNAYCKLICGHMSCDLSEYFISEKAVSCYLDINSPVGILSQYICETSSTYKSPYSAVGRFLKDFQKWGLGDGEFLKIAYETFIRNPKYEKTLIMWKNISER